LAHSASKFFKWTKRIPLVLGSAFGPWPWFAAQVHHHDRKKRLVTEIFVKISDPTDSMDELKVDLDTMHPCTYHWHDSIHFSKRKASFHLRLFERSAWVHDLVYVCNLGKCAHNCNMSTDRDVIRVFLWTEFSLLRCTVPVNIWCHGGEKGHPLIPCSCQFPNKWEIDDRCPSTVLLNIESWTELYIISQLIFPHRKSQSREQDDPCVSSRCVITTEQWNIRRSIAHCSCSVGSSFYLYVKIISLYRTLLNPRRCISYGFVGYIRSRWLWYNRLRIDYNAKSTTATSE
jgi:hypothetical protein